MSEQRKWKYIEPGEDGVTPVEHIWTEAQIIRDFYPWWCKQMRKVDKANLISHEACIEDWVVVNWAERIE